MATINYHQPDGSTSTVETDETTTVMRAAVNNGVSGIVGECGGQAMCATCHVYVRDGFLDQLPPISDDEEEMLECTADPRQDNSRLGCQIPVDGSLERIDVDVPESQV